MSQLRENLHNYTNLNPLEFELLKRDYNLTIQCDKKSCIIIDLPKLNWNIKIEPEIYRPYITSIILSWYVTSYKQLAWIRFSQFDDEPYWKSVVANGDINRSNFPKNIVTIMYNLFKLNYIEKHVYNTSYWVDDDKKQLFKRH